MAPRGGRASFQIVQTRFEEVVAGLSNVPVPFAIVAVQVESVRAPLAKMAARLAKVTAGFANE
jgi:hypothetical protein